MAIHRDATRILLSLAGVFLVFGVVVSILPTRAELAETNYHANLIRIQNCLFSDKPKAVLAGSSISGRMLPSYFEGTALQPLANLGIDGAGVLFALEMVAQRPPPVVLVETNRICKPLDSNSTMLDEAMHTPLFRAARRIPLLRTECRPSSMLYSWVKQNRESLVPVAAPSAPAPQKADSVAPMAKSELPADFEPTRQRAAALLRQLQQSGSHIILVRLPTGGRTPLEESTLLAGSETARELNLPEIDLEAECLTRGFKLGFTDGTHMTPASAKQVSVLLAELVQQKLAPGGQDR